jgi:tetratricopeptide (TPR) repeat protein
MTTSKVRNIDARICLGLFIGMLVVYILTLCPSIFIGDSAREVCRLLGVGSIPPTLYPVWQILAKIFGYFSRRNPAYGINLLSAMAGAGAVSLLYWTLSQIGRSAYDKSNPAEGPSGIKRIGILTAVLMLGFSRSFWEAAVTAGSDTLNALLLIIPAVLLVKYSKTRRKRYLILFSFLYALGIVNSPTLLLFFPVYFLALLILMKDIFNDVRTIVVMVLAFGLGLVAVFYQPYALKKSNELTGYVINSGFQQELIYYGVRYLNLLRQFFISKDFSFSWVFYLVIPVFVPLLYLLLRGCSKKQPAATEGQGRKLVRMIVMAGLLAAGLLFMLDLFVGPVGWMNMVYPLYKRYLVAYILVAVWLSYVVRYWLLVLPLGGKSAFRSLAVAALIVPMVSIVMNYNLSAKSGFKIPGRFAREVFNSVGDVDDPVIVVQSKRKSLNYGDILRYYRSYNPLNKWEESTVVDLHDVAQVASTKRIDLRKHYFSLVLGDPEFTLPAFAAQGDQKGPYDLISTLVNLQVAMAAAPTSPRPIFLVNRPLFDDRESIRINTKFRFVPSGALYRMQNMYFIEEHETVANNITKWWEEFGERWETPSTQDKKPEFSSEMLRLLSLAADEAGAYCEKHGYVDQAQKIYKQAIELDRLNYSATSNLVDIYKGMPEKEEELGILQQELEQIYDRRYNDLERAGKITAVSAEDEEQIEAIKTQLLWLFTTDYGPISDSEIYIDIKDLLDGITQDRTDLTYLARRLYLLRLARDFDPENPELPLNVANTMHNLLAVSAKLYDQDDIQLLLMQQIHQLGLALELGTSQPSQAYVNMARVYKQLKNNDAAFEWYSKAIEVTPNNAEALAFYVQHLIKDRSKLDELYDKSTSVLYSFISFKDPSAAVSEIANSMKLVTTVMAYQGKTMADIQQFSENELRQNPENLGLILWMTDFYYRNKDYRNLLGLEISPELKEHSSAMTLYQMKGNVLQELGLYHESIVEYEKCYSLLLSHDDAQTIRNALLNNIAWGQLMYGIQSGKREELIKGLELARSLYVQNPAVVQYWDAYGWALFHSGADDEDAYTLIRGAYLRYPEHGDIGYHYASILLKKGEKEKAIKIMREALAAGMQAYEEQLAIETLKANGVAIPADFVSKKERYPDLVK